MLNSLTFDMGNDVTNLAYIIKNNTFLSRIRIFESPMDNSPPHFFFFPAPAPGHTLPAVDLAKLFAARGARVTLILAQDDTSASAAAAVSRLRDAGHTIALELLPLPAAEAGLPPGHDSLDKVKTPEEAGKFFEALQLLEPAFRRLVSDLRPDCVVTDTFLPWTADVAEEFGVPRIIFPGTSNFAYAASHAIREFSPQAAVASDAELFALPGLPDEIKMTKAMIPDRSDGQQQVVDLWRRVEEANAKTYGLVMNSFYQLEKNYIKHMEDVVGKKTWQVGPVSLSNVVHDTVGETTVRRKQPSKDAQTCINWLDSKKPDSVLYICFGSMCTLSPPQMAEIAAALEEMCHVPFIWVVKNVEVLPEGFEERVGERGLVIKGWAPQTVILSHSSVGGFVTHCGWNSVLEGLTSGLPMVTWPAFAEQFYNERLVTEVVRVGVGVGVEKWGKWEVEKEVVTREKVKEAVGRVMGDGEEAEGMRRRARAAAEAAKMAVAEGGSSYLDLDRLIDEVKGMRVSK